MHSAEAWQRAGTWQRHEAAATAQYVRCTFPNLRKTRERYRSHVLGFLCTLPHHLSSVRGFYVRGCTSVPAALCLRTVNHRGDDVQSSSNRKSRATSCIKTLFKLRQICNNGAKPIRSEHAVCWGCSGSRSTSASFREDGHRSPFTWFPSPSLPSHIFRPPTSTGKKRR